MGWIELVGVIVGTGVLSTALTLWFGRKKADVEAEVTLSGGYGDFVKELREERAELKKERTEMREELRETHRDNVALRIEIGDLRSELRAVKTDLGRVLAGQPPLTDWTQQS